MMEDTNKIKSTQEKAALNWLESKKPLLLEFLNNGGISKENYETVRRYKGFRTNEEVDAWVKELIMEEPKKIVVKQKVEQLL